MPFDSADPRNQLAVPAPVPRTAAAAAQFFDHINDTSDTSELGSRTWWTRAQNFVVAHTLAMPDEILRRASQPDEYAVLFPTGGGAVIRAGKERIDIDSPTVVFVPPGDSEIVLTRQVEVVRLFTVASEDLVGRSENAAAYEQPDQNVAPLVRATTPAGGFKVRAYRIADYPYEEGRFARIFTSTNFMVNMFDPDPAPRDVTKLSPHHHDDFEQASIAVRGSYVHHIRYPWGSDLNEWRKDEHVRVGIPSIAIIPPPTIHTSQSIGTAGNQLIDVFCPPRTDFASQPGWVINADDYARTRDER